MLHKPYSTKTLIGAGTYNGLRTLFATAARRLRRPTLVPAVQKVSHEPESGD